MRILLISSAALALLLSACSTGQGTVIGQQSATAPESLQEPAAIPQDSLKPWEALDADGFVDPATARMSSAINGDSEFWRGLDAWQVEGGVVPDGQALMLDTGDAGSGQRAIATYRIPLAGENPATLATDINMYLRSDGTRSEYNIGIANYTTGRWDWSGPFSDGRIRLPVDGAATGDYISGLGNAFISVAVHDGSRCDIVGISLNQLDPADTQAPPAPTNLTADAVDGGLELHWSASEATDLAGYGIYWRDSPIISLDAPGVRRLGYLEGATRHVLSGISGQTFVAVTAVDLNGNESDPLMADGSPLAGSAPTLQLTASGSAGVDGSVINLQASGASLYDWDLDGDGIFELTGSSEGSQAAVTNLPGIIRPAVRGIEGTAVALEAVSLVITPDLPPMVALSCSDNDGVVWYGGQLPFTTTLDGSGSSDDGGPLTYNWDTLGDGNFTSSGSVDNQEVQYSASGLYNATLRVEDSGGNFAQASVAVRVRQVAEFNPRYYNEEDGTGLHAHMAIVGGMPALAYFWDSGPASDGIFYQRALDPQGYLWDEPIWLETSDDKGQFPWLTVINGNPAIAWVESSNGNLYYTRATTSTGGTRGQWPEFPVQVATGPVSRKPVLLEVDGQPAIAWVSNQATDRVYYKRATGNSGTGGGDWPGSPVELASGAEFNWLPEMVIVDGNPAVGFMDSGNLEAKYIRALNSTGATELDWPALPITISGADAPSSKLSLAVINGNPAFTYLDVGISGLKYVRATTTTGSSVSDWPGAVTIEAGNLEGADYHSLAEVGGYPMVAYADFGVGLRTKLRRGLDQIGSSWGPEMLVAPSDENLSDAAWEWIQLYELDGLPAVSVYNGSQQFGLFCTLDLY